MSLVEAKHGAGRGLSLQGSGFVFGATFYLDQLNIFDPFLDPFVFLWWDNRSECS